MPAAAKTENKPAGGIDLRKMLADEPQEEEVEEKELNAYERAAKARRDKLEADRLAEEEKYKKKEVLPLTNRQKSVYRAKIAEQCERYDEMCDHMLETVRLCNLGKSTLTASERTLFAVGIKNMVLSRRNAWRAVKNMENFERRGGNTDNAGKAEEYRRSIERDMALRIDKICELLRAVQATIKQRDDDEEEYKRKNPKKKKIPKGAGAKTGTAGRLFGAAKMTAKKQDEGPTPEELEEQRLLRIKMEEKCYYHKMMADQFRYKADFTPQHQYVKDDALKTYKMASDLADQYLEPTNMTRLNNALAYSVFLAEVMADYDKAVAVAKPAFESAVRKMDHLDGITYEKSALVMQLLRDNMMIWTDMNKK